jgi:hypothetical protein
MHDAIATQADCTILSIESSTQMTPTAYPSATYAFTTASSSSIK